MHQVSTYIANTLANFGIYLMFAPTCGGSIFLNNAISNHPCTKIVYPHPPQCVRSCFHLSAGMQNSKSSFHIKSITLLDYFRLTV